MCTPNIAHTHTHTHTYAAVVTTITSRRSRVTLVNNYDNVNRNDNSTTQVLLLLLLSLLVLLLLLVVVVVVLSLLLLLAFLLWAPESCQEPLPGSRARRARSRVRVSACPRVPRDGASRGCWDDEGSRSRHFDRGSGRVSKPRNRRVSSNDCFGTPPGARRDRPSRPPSSQCPRSSASEMPQSLSRRSEEVKQTRCSLRALGI